ncbi:MAG: coenzyme F420-0:L-glutamate ligase [Candidatus Methylarchaceae archaeon HK01B]|nr:coenzyme F420-0:L-glutamate ligase [Candidatus Methylarchaceae archaeon HK01B]
MVDGGLSSEIKIIGIKGIPEVKPGDDLASLIIDGAQGQGIKIVDGDVLVVTHKIVSKAEGRLVDLKGMTPSKFASMISGEKDPRLVEVVLREAKRIVRMDRSIMIVETKHGFVCANAGVDRSNIGGEDMVSLLPIDPDRSARSIRAEIKKRAKVDVAVVISDTFGRPWREGQTNIAIGVAGLEPILDYRGRKDMHGYLLKITSIAVADELASAAELVMGKTGMTPVAIIRGYRYVLGESSARALVRLGTKDLFR